MKGNLNQRADGRLEWICKHGIGHTIAVPKTMNSEHWSSWVHTCDGCCDSEEFRKEKLMWIEM